MNTWKSPPSHFACVKKSCRPIVAAKRIPWSRSKSNGCPTLVPPSCGGTGWGFRNPPLSEKDPALSLQKTERRGRGTPSDFGNQYFSIVHSSQRFFKPPLNLSACRGDSNAFSKHAACTS